jgi:hypothetical protein
MKSSITPIDILQMMREGAKLLPPDDLAFLYATGKNELLLRDLLAIHMSKSLELNSDEVVAREWKRHDLTVLKSGIPKLLIEGKVGIHLDAANPKKLLTAKKSMKADLENDINKMTKTLKNVSDGSAYITNALFTVEISKNADFNYGQVTYAKSHISGARKYKGYESLVVEARERLNSVLGNYGELSSGEIEIGKYAGTQVHLDFFVLRVS